MTRKEAGPQLIGLVFFIVLPLWLEKVHDTRNRDIKQPKDHLLVPALAPIKVVSRRSCFFWPISNRGKG
jgi:hypothetical protein